VTRRARSRFVMHHRCRDACVAGDRRGYRLDQSETPIFQGWASCVAAGVTWLPHAGTAGVRLPLAVVNRTGVAGHRCGGMMRHAGCRGPDSAGAGLGGAPAIPARRPAAGGLLRCRASLPRTGASWPGWSGSAKPRRWSLRCRSAALWAVARLIRCRTSTPRWASPPSAATPAPGRCRPSKRWSSPRCPASARSLTCCGTGSGPQTGYRDASRPRPGQR
jgi:hypothetical protein